MKQWKFKHLNKYANTPKIGFRCKSSYMSRRRANARSSEKLTQNSMQYKKTSSMTREDDTRYFLLILSGIIDYEYRLDPETSQNEPDEIQPLMIPEHDELVQRRAKTSCLKRRQKYVFQSHSLFKF
jgi:hypothetical protein